MDNLEHRIQAALGEAAERWVTDYSPQVLTADLVHRVGRRRRRRAGILAGGTITVLGAAVAAGLLLPAASPGGQQHLAVAGSGPTNSPSAVAGAPRNSPGVGTPSKLRPGASPTPPTTALPGPAKAPSPIPTHRPPPDSPASTSLSGPVSRPGPVSPSGQGSSTPSVVTVVPPAPAVIPVDPIIAAPPTADGVVLTIADNGRTVHLGVGQHLMVDLQGSPIYPWSQPAASNAAVLQAQPSGVAATNGSAVARFLAASKGQSTLTAAETPHCHPACGLPSRLWMVTVVVG